MYLLTSKSQEEAAMIELGTSIHLRQPLLKSRPTSSTWDDARITNTFKATVKSKEKPAVAVAAGDLARLWR